MLPSHFNPHSHEGSDAIPSATGFSIPAFQSTLPRREWQISQLSVIVVWRFQSTLPRREWRTERCRMDKGSEISIHTPTKGVTKLIYKPLLISGISIHTPTKGVTLFRRTLLFQSDDFNPHSHEGSDSTKSRDFSTLNDFNPHSHEGSDSEMRWLSIPEIDWFQSTLPRREWLCDIFLITASANFNPHSHEGSDRIRLIFWRSWILFQSTLPRREWRMPR